MKIKGIFNSRILGGRDEPIYTYEDQTVTEIECALMVQDKKCDGKEMNCDRLNGCQLEEKVNPEYKWPIKVVREGIKCSFYRILIEAENEDENIFTFYHNKCRTKDGSCQLKDQTTIWNKNEIIHKCPS